MAVALPGSINGSDFGSAKMSHRDGSEEQRPSAHRRTARDHLHLSDQGGVMLSGVVIPNGPWLLVISDREPQVPPEGSRRETALVDG